MEGNVHKVTTHNGVPVESPDQTTQNDDLTNKEVVEPTNQDQTTQDDTPEIDETSVLKFFEKKGRQVSSIEELFNSPEPTVIEKEIELPENIKAFYDFYKETGGSFEDYVSLNKDFSSMDDNSVLAKYFALKNPSFSSQDVLDYIAQEFGIDEDEMEDSEIRRRNLNKKMALGEAINTLTGQRDKHRADLASRKAEVPEKDEFDEFKAYKSQKQEQSDRVKGLQAKFTEQRNELFGDKFEGFSFNIGTNEPLVYMPENHRNLASDEMQSAKFVTSNFFDENGAIKDVEGFHKLIYMARNQEKILKAAYDKGAADAILNHEKESKNLDMDRTPPVVSNNGQVKIRVIEGSGGNKPLIKAR